MSLSLITNKISSSVLFNGTIADPLLVYNFTSDTFSANSPTSRDAVVGMLPETRLRLIKILEFISHTC